MFVDSLTKYISPPNNVDCLVECRVVSKYDSVVQSLLNMCLYSVCSKILTYHTPIKYWSLIKISNEITPTYIRVNVGTKATPYPPMTFPLYLVSPKLLVLLNTNYKPPM